MREILFKGKRVDNGEWVEGYYFVEAIEHDFMERTFVYPSFIKIKYGDHFQDHEVIPETIGQFTGLCDKNGTKIFEGDVLRGDRYPFNSEEEDNYYLEIIWIEEEACFAGYTFKNPQSKVRGISEGNCERLEDIEDFEIIGNIHDKEAYQWEYRN